MFSGVDELDWPSPEQIWDELEQQMWAMISSANIDARPRWCG